MVNKSLKRAVLELFQSGRILYYSDIALELNADLQDVVSVCRELFAEGKIFVQK